MQTEELFLIRIVYSGECVFHVDGKVNKNNANILEA